MKKIFFLNIFFLIIFFSCEKNTLAGQTNGLISSSKTENANNDFKEVSDLTKTLADYDDDVKKLNLKYQDLSINIRCISDRAYLEIKKNNQAVFDWKPVLLNFYYDTSFEDAEKDIHLLLNNKDTSSGYIIFPGFTEQYSTYFVYFFSKNTLLYAGNYEAKEFVKGNFSYNPKSQELAIISSDKISKLTKIKETETKSSHDVDKDLKLLAQSEQHSKNEKFEDYSENKNYFIKTFDVDKDGINDKIVSHNRYQGDELLIFLGNRNKKFDLALKAVNFSEDGGNQISDIKETKDGFELVTEFPDRGTLIKKYSISALNKKFILKQIVKESFSWQDKTSENCTQILNVDLKSNTAEVQNLIAKTKMNCKKSK
ncbi:hypothetical protein [Chryseobacterium sp.]|uniref:hypothetical protein n=1 Tax=Chryseobacterium sp. TaxID=1871047 RepID=UPI00289CF66C|nr:hypothetical protein [Chryseobacterium sp.]